MTDWQAWHDGYADPESSLSRRLVVVRRRIAESVVALGDGLRTVLSLCAGDGRDLLPVLAAAHLDGPMAVRLVELDAELSEAARRRATELVVAAEVLTADAGEVAAWSGLAPVDLLVLCGIFGNVSDDDVQAAMDAAATVTQPGARVIWTRGGGEPDRRPTVRRWWTDHGFDELLFDGPPARYGVGVVRRRSDAPSRDLPARIFSFVR